MSGLCDLRDYDLTDAERLALCAELARLNRLPSSTAVPAGEPSPSRLVVLPMDGDQ